MSDKPKQKECVICKHYGDETPDPFKLEKTQIFDEIGNPLMILLCRAHAVELFKMGQRKFLMSHYKILVDIISSDETKFLEVLENTVRNNRNDLY
jgi:hypothetical protein